MTFDIAQMLRWDKLPTIATERFVADVLFGFPRSLEVNVHFTVSANEKGLADSSFVFWVDKTFKVSIKAVPIAENRVAFMAVETLLLWAVFALTDETFTRAAVKSTEFVDIAFAVRALLPFPEKWSKFGNHAKMIFVEQEVDLFFPFWAAKYRCVLSRRIVNSDLIVWQDFLELFNLGYWNWTR